MAALDGLVPSGLMRGGGSNKPQRRGGRRPRPAWWPSGLAGAAEGGAEWAPGLGGGDGGIEEGRPPKMMQLMKGGGGGKK